MAALSVLLRRISGRPVVSRLAPVRLPPRRGLAPVRLPPMRGLAAGPPGDAQPPGLSPPACEHELEAYRALGALGHRPAVAAAVLSALRGSGLSGAGLLSVVHGLIGRPEVGHDGGLEALVAAIEKQLAREEGKARVVCTVLTPRAVGWDVAEGDPSRFQIEGYDGMTISDVAKHGDDPGSLVLAELLECACSGVMACSTCHIVIAPEWFERVGEPSEEERDMIDLAFEPTDTSRLGCQVVLRPELNGLKFRVPAGANNMMDNIPFPD